MEKWDWTKVRDFLEAGTIIWGIISGCIVLWLRGQFVTRKTYDAEIKRLDLAISHCRQTSNGEANDLKLAVERLNGTLTGVSARLQSGEHLFERLEAQYDNINDYLRKAAS
jgi:hypothetical protein